MWTNENRRRYDRSKLRYPSDLTDEEWALIAPVIPPAKRGGGKRTVSIRGKKATTEEPSLIVDTPKSGRLRIVDCPAPLMAQLQERRSIAQAEAAVAGRPLAPWVFPAALDPTRPLNGRSTPAAS